MKGGGVSFPNFLIIRYGSCQVEDSVWGKRFTEALDPDKDPLERSFDEDKWVFHEYKRVFNNEIEHLSNEYILRIRKKGYILDNVWGKCQQNYKKTNEAWHDEGYEEDELWRNGDEKTDYDPPYVNDETLSLGARFKAMIRKELEGRKIQKLGGNDRDRLDYQSYGILLNLQRLRRNIKSLRRNHFRYDGIKSLREDEDNLKISAKFQNLKAMLREFLVLILNVQ
ncbi:hypothetical protein Tco_0830058 [Tanacetum coccineum]